MIEPPMMITVATLATASTVLFNKVFDIAGARLFVAALLFSAGLSHIVFYLCYGVSGLGALYGVAYFGYVILSAAIIATVMTLFAVLRRGRPT